jgi:Mg-chelatase subunit ChlD
MITPLQFISFIPKIFSVARRFVDSRLPVLGDCRGTIMHLVGVGIIPLIGFTAVATDAGRAYLVKSRLSSAVDAAALAAGQTLLDPVACNNDVTRYFAANFPPGYMGAVVTGPTFDCSLSAETLLITASASVPTTLTKVLGHETMTVSASAEITRMMKALDVVLAIDVSGSMNNNISATDTTDRIVAAKNAAKQLVNDLFGSSSWKEYLSIGVVPWSAKVNIRTNTQTFSTSKTTTKSVPAFINPETGLSQSTVWYANTAPQVPLLAAPPSGWRGCVFNRYIHDGDPNGEKPDDGDLHMGLGTWGGLNWQGWQPVYPGNHAQAQFAGDPYSGWGNECGLSIGGETCASCPNTRITPLNHTKATVISAIDALSASGNTNMPAGLAWAWEVLSPEEPFTEAVPDPDYERDQAIILLTDGENCPRSGDGYKRVFGNCASDPDLSTGRPGMEERLRKLAANLKSQGILLYVIQFANGDNDPATPPTRQEELLMEIASGTEAPFFMNAPSEADLKMAFREIANHLAQLHLSQ